MALPILIIVNSYKSPLEMKVEDSLFCPKEANYSNKGLEPLTIRLEIYQLSYHRAVWSCLALTPSHYKLWWNKILMAWHSNSIVTLVRNLWFRRGIYEDLIVTIFFLANFIYCISLSFYYTFVQHMFRTTSVCNYWKWWIGLDLTEQ